MGLLLVLRAPLPRSKSLRRATRAQRRERYRADAEDWATARERGLLLDVSVEVLLPLLNAAGGNRLPIMGQLNPWSDGVLVREDLSQLDADVDRLRAVAGNDVERGLVAALMALLARWRNEPGLTLHWYGD
ncbi:hypothetical protein PSH03_000748 [Micromonospora sp. PSH03]|uniref:hypothetical protein n=1 Tax=Micromonospora salmantinae TaxID=2911211 RepID=UPI001EE904A1|nr:hypothetical protein [Micromonospora salmantinae]MCG5455865.1 hypothetical protein [Micromonospora salmantinae]